MPGNVSYSLLAVLQMAVPIYFWVTLAESGDIFSGRKNTYYIANMLALAGVAFFYAPIVLTFPLTLILKD